MKNTTQETLRVGIVGYGNLGKGVALAIHQNPDMELVAIFTRRAPSALDGVSNVVSLSQIGDYTDRIDVMILCGGSSTDLPEQVLAVAKLFHTVDSFDTHAKIPAYFAEVDAVSKAANRVSLISTGWDPGLFSMLRLLGETVLPQGETHTFWGKGLSQGHSDAVRRVAGVRNAVQYTIPSEEAMEQVRAGSTLSLTTAQRHKRVCYVVPESGADVQQIAREIKEMPHYFEPYDTTVHFITEAELKENHAGMPHGGTVFRAGTTSEGTKQRVEFALALESNPEFTASVLVAFARAVGKLAKEGQSGARTVFDIPLGHLSPKTPETLREILL